jgi:DNA-binding NtrC family response regulator
VLDIPHEARASVSILIVDDERTLRESCASVLQSEGYAVSVSGKGEEALDLLRRRRFDIVLLDLFMSQVPGMHLLQVALETHPDSIVIIMTGNPSITSSIEALQAGAWDYVPKPFSGTHLQILIGRAAHTVLIARETREVQAERAGAQGHSDKITVLGTSAAFRKVIELARKVAATDASVFITGESGTGKELIAEFIHHHSRRSTRQLVAINCAAMPEPLLESEMFGHCKGAFTGAVRDKPGLLETANGGTLLFDELIEMSKATQAKVLRVIQDGVVRRVGSETTDAVVNVRFIAATNRDPEEAVRSGCLREDLYFRLRVVPIHLPPLRNRPEDIAPLANHFLTTYWTRHRAPAAPLPRFSSAAMRALRAQSWRGNVRELQNVIEHTVVLIEPGAEIQSEDLPFLGDREAPPTRGAPPPVERGTGSEEEFYVGRERLVAEWERRYLRSLLKRAGGNMSKAARIASIDRTTLYRLMERHGLQRELATLDID